MKLEARINIELGEAYVRSIAVAGGMLLVAPDWVQLNPFPQVEALRYANFDGATHLDDWLAWYRMTSIRLEQIQQEQTFEEGAISLGMMGDYPVIRDNLRQYDRSTIVPNLVADIRNEVPIGFELQHGSAGWPFNLDLGSRGFLRGIAVTIALPDDQMKKWKFSAEVHVPNVSRPISFSTVPSFEAGPDWFADPYLYNRLVNGMWRLKINYNPLHGVDAVDQARLARNAWPILDIQLYVRAVFL